MCSTNQMMSSRSYIVPFFPTKVGTTVVISHQHVFVYAVLTVWGGWDGIRWYPVLVIQCTNQHSCDRRLACCLLTVTVRVFELFRKRCLHVYVRICVYYVRCAFLLQMVWWFFFVQTFLRWHFSNEEWKQTWRLSLHILLTAWQPWPW